MQTKHNRNGLQVVGVYQEQSCVAMHLAPLALYAGLSPFSCIFLHVWPDKTLANILACTYPFVLVHVESVGKPLHLLRGGLLNANRNNTSLNVMETKTKGA